MILSSELEKNNIIEVIFPIDSNLLQFIIDEDWQSVDQYFLKSSQVGGELYEFLTNFLNFKSIEHIIAIRSAPDDEDGIWHDDGSRLLGFTISLTIHSQSVSGGELRFRKKGDSEFLSISTRSLGGMLLFKTGEYGFEHMVSAVTSSKRIVLAGWCS
jgi:hypothetical protein